MRSLYKVEYTHSARDDIKSMKEYISDTFGYRELGENFVQKMKAAEKLLQVFPAAYNKVGFRYRGFDIYLKPYQTYLFFYIVDELHITLTVLRVFKDGMNWKHTLQSWLEKETER